MPLTPLQQEILAVLARTPAAGRYLAGGSALHSLPHSTRFSHDLDLFHDELEQVARAFEEDSETLRGEGFEVELILSQPGHIRALVRRGEETTRVDWARDSSWRFMPLVQDRLGGWMLDPVDLATNKVLVLAGRDEPRDFVDLLFATETILPLGPLVWAAAGKDPGFTPLSLLEQLKRRGRYREEDLRRLDLATPLDLREMKQRWLRALEEAERFIASRPPGEAGCLYYSPARGRFIQPEANLDLNAQGVVPHFGRPGGVLPHPADPNVNA